MKSGKIFIIILHASLLLYFFTSATRVNAQKVTSNVIASKWFKVDSSVWTHTDADSLQYSAEKYDFDIHQWQNFLDTIIVFHATVPTPLISAGVKNSGRVLFYYKDSTGNGDTNLIGKVMPISRVAVENSHNRYNTFTTATNRLTKSNYFFIQRESNTPGQGFSIKTNWIGSDAKYKHANTFDPQTGFYVFNDIKYQELAPKTALFFRYIIIPAAKTKKIKAPVDYNDYNAVIKYYHLEDK